MNLEELKTHETENPEFSDEMLGQIFGVYQITKEIGRGGMGVVYLAKRIDGEFNQDVAIKFVKRGMDTHAVLKRFRNERQILASLIHPNVALLYDGGTTREGLPYFVMEYIQGKPLYKFCDHQKLNLKERLKIFLQICEAVHEVHQIKVIHRDLKPSNILVTKEGTPKLLDFGIAKLLDPELADATIEPTATQMRVMTPEYASPEHVSGGEITPVSDIYSLGVLLYELVSGHRPYRLKNRSPFEIARVICEEPPERLGVNFGNRETAVERNETQTLQQITELRASSSDELRRELSGDLEQIVMNALQKQPDERYQTARELAEDIRLYLQGKPIKKRTAFFDEKASSFSSSTAEETVSLAVLPLRTLGSMRSEGASDEYLSVGLTDAMITRLSNVRRLVVRPTGSVLRFADYEDMFAAGRELGVDYVLCGTIRPAGNRVRISAQLLDIKTGSTLWSDKFDEDFCDVLALEDLVAEKVAKLLIPKLTGGEKLNLAKRGTDNVEAFKAYLQGKHYLYLFTPENFQKAISCFEQAIEIDPNYALAYVALSDCYFVLTAFASRPPHECFPLLEKMAKKAIELDEFRGDAYANLGMSAVYHLDLEEGESLLKQGLKCCPNQQNGYVWYSVLLTMTGRHEEAIEKARKALDLDPLSEFHDFHYTWTLYHARRFDDARERVRKVAQNNSNFAHGQGVLGWLFRYFGDLEKSIRHGEKAVALSPETPWLAASLAASYAEAGKREKALDVLQKLEETAKNQYVSPYCLSLAHFQLGDEEKGFKLLERAVAENDVWFIWIASEPQLDAFRNKPRFQKLVKKIKERAASTDSASEKLTTAETNTENFTSEIETEEKSNAEMSFFRRHNLKLGIAAVLITGIFVAYLTGILEVRFEKTTNNRQDLAQKNQIRSIAILPFKNETSDAGNDYICDGLSENLINRLSALPDLRVMPRSASFSYKNKQLEPQEIGREMNVETILTGAVSKEADEFIVKIQLLRVADGAEIMNFGFREKQSRISILQKEIADILSDKLNISANEKPRVQKSYTENSEAFEFYMKGEFHRQQATPDDTRKAIEFYEKAIKLDENFALAYQGLSLAYRIAPAYGVFSPQEAYPKAKDAAMNALAIDPTLGTAHTSLASIKFVYDWDFAGAEREYKQAIELAPNSSEAHSSYANFLIAMKRSDEAINELKIAQQLDPLSVTIPANIGWALYVAGRFDEAEAQIKSVLTRDPNFARAYMNLGEIYEEQGKYDEAITAFQKFKQLSGDILADMALGHVYGVAGRRAEALKIAKELEEKVLRKEVSPFLPAVVYAGLKENDKAFYWLERAYQEHSNWLTLLKIGRRLKPLHDDPRFDDLLQRVGLKK